MKTQEEIYGSELLEEELSKFNPETNTFINYSNDPDDPTSINDNFIFSIYEDRSGVIWFGTNTGGVNYFHPFTQVFERFINSPKNKNSLSDNAVLSMHTDKRRQLLDRHKKRWIR